MYLSAGFSGLCMRQEIKGKVITRKPILPSEGGQGNAVKRLQEVPRRTDLPDVQERRRLARERNQKSAVPVTPAKQAARQEDTAEQRKSDGYE